MPLTSFVTTLVTGDLFLNLEYLLICQLNDLHHLHLPAQHNTATNTEPSLYYIIHLYPTISLTSLLTFQWPRGASGDLSVGFGNLLNHFLSLPARIPLHLFVLNNVNHIQITSSITNVSFDPSFYSRKIFLVTEVNHLATQVNQQTLIGWKSHD